MPCDFKDAYKFGLLILIQHQIVGLSMRVVQLTASHGQRVLSKITAITTWIRVRTSLKGILHTRNRLLLRVDLDALLLCRNSLTCFCYNLQSPPEPCRGRGGLPNMQLALRWGERPNREALAVCDFCSLVPQFSLEPVRPLTRLVHSIVGSALYHQGPPPLSDPLRGKPG